MKIEYAVVSECGKREEMEDAYCFKSSFLGDQNKFFACVIDGHGGSYVAEYVAAHLSDCFVDSVSSGWNIPGAFKESYVAVDKEVANYHDQGACALSVFFDGLRVHYAYAGDCSLFVGWKSKTGVVTRAHRVGNKDEEARVLQSGGFIYGNHFYIPSGHGLQPLRTIGDRAFKQYGIIPRPDCGSLAIQKATILVLGTDGLFDLVSTGEIKKITKLSADVSSIATGLKTRVVENGAKDNFTFIVISLEP